MILDMTIWVCGFAAAICTILFICWRYTIHQERCARQNRETWLWWIGMELRHLPDQIICWGYNLTPAGRAAARTRRGPYCKLCQDYGCPHPHTGVQSDLCPICGHSPGIHDNYKHAAHEARKDMQ